MLLVIVSVVLYTTSLVKGTPVETIESPSVTAGQAGFRTHESG